MKTDTASLSPTKPAEGQNTERQYSDKTKQEKESKKESKSSRLRLAFRRMFPSDNAAHNREKIIIPRAPCRPDRDHYGGCFMYRDEWEVVQRNFPGPVGQYYSTDDPDKPEAYMYTDDGRLAPIPQYQHDDRNLPPYNWARLSALPTPVVVDDSWSSLLAAQREKSRLLETQKYISLRIAEIDRKVRAVMDTKHDQDPKLYMRFVEAQEAGVLLEAGVPNNAARLTWDRRAGREVDPAEYDWRPHLRKVFELRERLSPVTLFPPPAV